MNKKKKLLFSLAILLMLLTLTGCDGDVIKKPILDFVSGFEYLPLRVEEAIRWVEYWFIESLGSMKCTILLFLQSLTDINAIARSMMKSMGNMNGIISFAQLFAVALIIVQFARGIWKTYFSTTDNQYAPTFFTQLKKLFTAVIAALLVPQLCLTAFLATTYIGSAAASILMAGGTTDASSSETPITIWNSMEADHVKLGTYCWEGQTQLGVSESKLDDLLGGSKENLPTGYQKYQVLRPEVGKDSNGIDLYKKYCVNGDPDAAGVGIGARDPNLKFVEGYKTKDVGETLRSSLGAKNVTIIGAYSLSQGVDLVVDAAATGASIALGPTVMTIVFLIILGVFFLAAGFFIISVSRRLVDLLVLILMSWWYIGSSVSDSPQQNSLGELGKKLLTICMTQLIMTLEIVMFFKNVVVGSEWSVWTLPISIAYFMVLTGTPSAVQGMVQSTGTGETASRAGKALGGAAKNILGG